MQMAENFYNYTISQSLQRYLKSRQLKPLLKVENFKYISTQYSPNSEITPQENQMIKLSPMDPVLTSKPEGETNIPEPENENFCKKKKR